MYMINNNKPNINHSYVKQYIRLIKELNIYDKNMDGIMLYNSQRRYKHYSKYIYNDRLCRKVNLKENSILYTIEIPNMLIDTDVDYNIYMEIHKQFIQQIIKNIINTIVKKLVKLNYITLQKTKKQKQIDNITQEIITLYDEKYKTKSESPTNMIILTIIDTLAKNYKIKTLTHNDIQLILNDTKLK